MRDDGIDESFIEYITYAISQVLICDAVQEAIDDGTIMVGADGHIHFFNETLH